METKNPLIITGPTASGKSEVALLLAEQLDGEIISADSMQVYRGLDIGTAKVSQADQTRIKHHLLDILDPGELFSVTAYQELAQAKIKDVQERGKLPIICGGTGQYISTLLDGLVFSPARADYKLREQLSQKDLAQLYHELSQIDPEAAAKIGPADQKRLIRALEIYASTGQTKSWHDQQSRKKAPAYQYSTFILNFDRPVLYDRINRRVLEMMQAGLLDELVWLASLDLPPSSTCLQAIGYKELLAHLKGESSLDQAVAKIQQASRNLAKRQLTWMRKISSGIWLNNQTAAEAASQIKAKIL